MGSISAPDIFRDTLDEYSRSAELNNQAQQLRQQQQAQQQQNAIQQGQLANQTAQQGNQNKMAPLLQQQQDLENQKAQFEKQQREAILGATQAAIKRGPNGEPQGIDYDKLENEATARGALPGSTNELQKQRLALGKQAQELTDEQAAAHIKENNRVHQIVAGIGASGPERSPQREAAFQQAAMQEGKDHGMKAIADWPTQAPTDSDLAAWDTKLGMHGQAIEDKLKESEAFKNMQGNVDMQELHSYLSAPTVPNEKLPPSQRTPASYASWKAKQSPLATFALNNTVSPTDIKDAAQGLVDGSVKWGDIVANRLPLSQRLNILKAAKDIDPNFDTGAYAIEQGVAAKAASGPWADTRVAYNTAIDHANQLLAASKALGNGDIQQLNKMKNFFATQFGEPEATTAQAIANAYNHEVTSVVAKGHMTDAEVAAGHGTLDVNKASPQQIASVAAAYKDLMTSKRDELDKQIKAGAGNKANNILNQSQGGKIRARDPQGKLHEAPAGTPLPTGWKPE